MTLLVKPLMPDVYQIPRGASVGGHLPLLLEKVCLVGPSSALDAGGR